MMMDYSPHRPQHIMGPGIAAVNGPGMSNPGMGSMSGPAMSSLSNPGLSGMNGSGLAGMNAGIGGPGILPPNFNQPLASTSAPRLSARPSTSGGPSNPFHPSNPPHAPNPSNPFNSQNLPQNLPPQFNPQNLLPRPRVSANPDPVPPLSTDDIGKVKGWLTRDKKYATAFAAQQYGAKQELTNLVGYTGWWEKDRSEPPLNRERWSITYPGSRRPATLLGKGKRKRREGWTLPNAAKLPKEKVEASEVLVPLRIEFDHEHHKMRDAVVWNAVDPLITPEIFAKSIVEDYSLPSSFIAVIAKQITDQLADFHAHAVLLPDPSSQESGKLSLEEERWWAKWRKGLRAEDGSVKRKRKRGEFVDFALGEGADGGEDLRILIRLDITLSNLRLEDVFEWDLDNPEDAPERFAAVYCIDLGLVGEFKTAIAHAIREQVLLFRKSLSSAGHPFPHDGSAVADDELRQAFCAPVLDGVAMRSQAEVPQHTPVLGYISDSELDRAEKELARRRKRKPAARRLLPLPPGAANNAEAKDQLRTARTPAIGFPELDIAAMEKQGHFAPVTSQRRAAAAAASANIANMVAQENGTVVLPDSALMMASVTPSNVGKEKEEEGEKKLFKPPLLPESVKHPRVGVLTPTPSTAIEPGTYITPLSADAPPPKPRLTAKQLRELEKEMQERMYVDGQHPNMIDGVWHCSNCGCPDQIAVGRRKGPLGDKSQCGVCGKYWHRHRRPRPVEYHPELEWHLAQKEAEERGVRESNRKRRELAKAMREERKAAILVAREAERAEAMTKGGEVPSDLAEGGEKSEESGDEGKSKERSTEPSTVIAAPVIIPPAPAVPLPSALSKPPAPGAPLPPGLIPPAPIPRPDWLKAALLHMHDKYPDDAFDVIARRTQPEGPFEWRVKCFDCPGKLYTPGPGETLDNYEVHLKNRQHRQRVNNRIVSAGGVPKIPAPAPSAHSLAAKEAREAAAAANAAANGAVAVVAGVPPPINTAALAGTPLVPNPAVLTAAPLSPVMVTPAASTAAIVPDPVPTPGEVPPVPAPTPSSVEVAGEVPPVPAPTPSPVEVGPVVWEDVPIGADPMAEQGAPLPEDDGMVNIEEAMANIEEAMANLEEGAVPEMGAEGVGEGDEGFPIE